MQRELLETNNLQTNTFSFSFDEAVTLKTMLESLPQDIFTPKFTRRNEKELNRYVFVFSMCYEHQKWKYPLLHPDCGNVFTTCWNSSTRWCGATGRSCPAFPCRRSTKSTPPTPRNSGSFCRCS